MSGPKMKYPNSTPLPSLPDLNDFTPHIEARVSLHQPLADRGALRAQADWQRHIAPLPRSIAAGTLGPVHNFVAACLPETLPDRIELVAYLTELGFLMDDVIDAGKAPGASSRSFIPHLAEMPRLYAAIMAEASQSGREDGSGESWSPRERWVLAVAREMFAVDAAGARVAFKWWERWVPMVMGRMGREKEVGSFDEYLEYRRVNVASHAAFGLFMFAFGLHIPEDQQETCLELSQSFWLQAALTNDYHSWACEQQTAAAGGEAFVANAIWVLMNKHSMTSDEAMRACRERASQYAAEYVQVVDAAQARDDLSPEAKRYLDLQRFAMSGNVVWSLQSPRYYPDQKLTAEQLKLASTIQAASQLGVENGNGVRPDKRKEQVNGGSETEGAAHLGGPAARAVPKLSTQSLEAPSLYLDSLPGKGIRDKTVDALNIWFRVPLAETATIKRAMHLLHGASLMLDDIQDASVLRRGKPATHIVFGEMQTINSAGYRFLGALTEVRRLESERCMDVFCDALRDLYIGQSCDVSWTFNLECPTEDEYLAMVDGKTAGLFRMLASLLDAKSNSPDKPDMALMTRFMTLLGRLFQIRDDYMNLTSAYYTEQKGFCEDLDEGKYSLPLVHALGRSRQPGSLTPKDQDSIRLLRSLLSQRRGAGKMSLDQKKLFLEHLDARGSLEYTRRVMDELQAGLGALAAQMGMFENASLRILLEALRV